MKKIALVLLTLAFVLSTTLFVTACGKKDTIETSRSQSQTESSSSSVEESSGEHEHTFATGWSYDDTHHWHKATCGHTAVISDKSAHILNDNDACSVCNYKKPTSSDYFLFTLLKDNTYKIEDVSSSGFLSEIVIPRCYEGKPVTIIGESAFKFTSELESVIIPNSVTTIEDSAFYECDNLTSVIIEDDSQLKSVGSFAFYYCRNLTSVSFGENSRLNGIGSYAFSGCGELSVVNVPDSVTSFGNSVFSSSDKLKYNEYDNAYYLGNDNNPYVVLIKAKSTDITSCEINSRTKFIHSSAFFGCNELTSIEIPNNVIDVGSSAFSRCKKLSTVFISDSVKNIGQNSFSYCSKLKSVSFSQNSQITSIDSDAFSNCIELTSLNIPDSITTIGDTAISGCDSLNVNEYDNAYYLGNENNPYVVLVKVKSSEIASCEINSNTKVIYSSAFSDCSKLTSLVIPDKVTCIGSDALSGCSSLESITLPFAGKTETNSNNTIHYGFGYIFGSNMYNGGVATKQYYYSEKTEETNYVTYYIPSSLKSVKITGGNIIRGAFYNCKGLTNIQVPDSVTSVGDNAFSGCKNLKYNEYDNAYYLGNDNNPYVVLIKAKSTDITSCEINSGTKAIIDEAFYYCKLLTSVTIPDSVTSIGDDVFCACSLLTSVTIGNSVTEIGSEAFRFCHSLTSVTIGSSVKKIKKNAFRDCELLTDVYITDVSAWCNIDFSNNFSNPLYYAQNLYLNNVPVTDLVIPEDVKRIGAYAFNNCSNLTSVTIGSSVTSIGVDAFFECYKLIEIYNRSNLNITVGSTDYGSIDYFAKNVYTLAQGESKLHKTTDGYIFYADGDEVYLMGYTGDQTALKLPDKFNGKNYAIYDYAFSRCSNLTSVTLGNGVTNIGNYAFSECSSLTSITIGNSVTSIGDYAFSNCSQLTSVTIGNGVTSIGSWAFNNCNGLNGVYITDVSAWCDIDFANMNSNPLYYAKNLYLNNVLLTELEIPESVTSICKYAFYNCSSLTSVKIGNNVTSIGDYAFNDCSGLTSVTIGDSVTNIGDFAFSNCSGLNGVYITDVSAWCNIDFAKMNSNPLYYAKNLYLNNVLLTELEIPESVTSICKYAFA